MIMRAVVLLSGGLDSATILYFAKRRGFDCYCLIFDYGQRHRREIQSAKRIAQKARCKWRVIKISFPWKGSALLDRGIPLPERRLRDALGGIPSTYVPARNTVFISLALSYAEVIGAQDIFIGANAVDFSGYPDCRPNYYIQFNKLLRLATKAGARGRQIKITTPLLKKAKAEIVGLGNRLGVPFELTWSCYRGSRIPCGKCDSCLLRAKGFMQAGISDPLLKE